MIKDRNVKSETIKVLDKMWNNLLFYYNNYQLWKSYFLIAACGRLF